MTDHTPEPKFIVEAARRQSWSWEVRWTNDLHGFATSGRVYARCDSEADAEKIAAALNACKGIPTAQLEGAKMVELANCLAWLNRQGGLGFNKHERIAAALAPFRKD